MPNLRFYYFLVSSFALAISCAAQPLLAEDAKYSKAKPAFNELSKNRERGIMFAPIIAPTAVAKPKTAVTRLKVKQAIRQAPYTGNRISKHTPPLDKQTAAFVKQNKASALTQNASAIPTDSIVFKAWLDKAGSLPCYKVGDKMVVNVVPRVDCNLLVFNYDLQGTLTQIFPNDYQPSNCVKSGEHIAIGGVDSPFEYQVAGKSGIERIFIYACPRTTMPPLTVAMSPLPNTPFRTAEMSPERYKELVNKSAVFFARQVKIVPKPGIKLAVDSQEAKEVAYPNKVELSFRIAESAEK